MDVWLVYTRPLIHHWHLLTRHWDNKLYSKLGYRKNLTVTFYRLVLINENTKCTLRLTVVDGVWRGYSFYGHFEVVLKVPILHRFRFTGGDTSELMSSQTLELGPGSPLWKLQQAQITIIFLPILTHLCLREFHNNVKIVALAGRVIPVALINWQ